MLQARAEAALIASVTVTGGRTVAVYPARQMVLPMVSWVTAGFVAPGVQCGSGQRLPIAGAGMTRPGRRHRKRHTPHPQSDR